MKFCEGGSRLGLVSDRKACKVGVLVDLQPELGGLWLIIYLIFHPIVAFCLSYFPLQIAARLHESWASSIVTGHQPEPIVVECIMAPLSSRRYQFA